MYSKLTIYSHTRSTFPLYDLFLLPTSTAFYASDLFLYIEAIALYIAHYNTFGL